MYSAEVRRGVVILAALAGVIPVVSFAVPFTPRFDPLIAELQLRRDSGELTVKQQNATVASLALLEAPSDSLATDLKTARAVTRKLAKAFPVEFDSSGGGAFIDGVGALMNDALRALRVDVSVAYLQPLDEAFNAIPWDPHGCPAHVKDFLDTAITLDFKTLQHRKNLARTARLLRRSLAVSARGMKVAVKCAEKLGVPLP